MSRTCRDGQHLCPVLEPLMCFNGCQPPDPQRYRLTPDAAADQARAECARELLAALAGQYLPIDAAKYLARRWTTPVPPSDPWPPPANSNSGANEAPPQPEDSATGTRPDGNSYSPPPTAPPAPDHGQADAHPTAPAP